VLKIYLITKIFAPNKIALVLSKILLKTISNFKKNNLFSIKTNAKVLFYLCFTKFFLLKKQAQQISK